MTHVSHLLDDLAAGEGQDREGECRGPAQGGPASIAPSRPEDRHKGVTLQPAAAVTVSDDSVLSGLSHQLLRLCSGCAACKMPEVQGVPCC